MKRTLETSTYRILRVRALALALFSLVSTYSIFAQADSIHRIIVPLPQKPVVSTSTPLHIDTNRTSAHKNSTPTITLPETAHHTSHVRPHSPRTAIILSAMLPGAGQVYNHQAWKIPIVYAGLGAVSYVMYDNYRQMKMFKDEYLYRVKHDDTPLLDKYRNYPTTNILNLYQAKNKDFQLYLFVDLAVYALNIVDAFVSAHLYDFEINDNLSLRIHPLVTPYNLAYYNAPRAAISMSWQF